MSVDAAQIQYRQEFIKGFEQHQSLVRDSVTNEAVIKGNQATFLVADSGGATAVTRGTNSLIPTRTDNNVQTTATLQEWHDLVNKTNFNIFASQGNQRQIMQQTTMAVLNRKIDDEIIAVLNTATNNTGATQTAGVQLAVHAQTKLGNNDVPFDGRICGLITPAFLGYLQLTKEFGSAEYVTKRPLESDGPQWNDSPGYYMWNNVKWIVHPNLPGKGTNDEKCFMYHESAVGHAVDKGGLECPIGYEEQQAYSWCRCTIYMGTVLLQNSGIVVMNHDGAAFS